MTLLGVHVVSCCSVSLFIILWRLALGVTNGAKGGLSHLLALSTSTSTTVHCFFFLY
jgi:hypothetical protein